MKSNIFLLVIDSLRSDRINEKNHAKIPNFEKLLESGTYFSQAISSGDGTGYAVGSIFTALNPFKHGANAGNFTKIHDKDMSFINYLANAGYNIYTHIPDLVNELGLEKIYRQNKGALKHYYRFDGGLGEEILQNFEESKMKEPWFFYVHTMDLHSPYEFEKKFNNSKYGLTDYDKALSSVDVWLGKIYEKINLEKTYFVITADHGTYVPFIEKNNCVINFETKLSKQKLGIKLYKKTPAILKPIKSKVIDFLLKKKIKNRKRILQNVNLSIYEKRQLFSDRTNIEHFLFDDLVRVPLLFLGPNIPKNFVVKKQVGTIDIFPTLCDKINLEIPKNLDGKSLELFFKEIGSERPIYMESLPGTNTKTLDVIGIRTSNYKYFRSISDPNDRVHLFDLHDDPFEENNISRNNPEIIREFETMITKIRKHVPNKFEKTNIDDSKKEEIEAELRRLGYM